jgi:DNA repair protein SbcD/Mre11
VGLKLLHSSDWHLGKSLFAKSLLLDQAACLAEIESIVVSEKPDLILLAGDLFDRSVPPEDAVKLLDQFLAKTILELKVPVAMIPGNHDSSTRVGVAADLLRQSGLHVFSTPESIEHPLQLEANGVKSSVYGIPYLEPAEWNFYFHAKNREAHTPLRTHAESLNAIIESLKPQLARDKAEDRRSILILHAYVTGGEPSESERPLSIGGSDLVPAELLKNFDYVALGHLHRPQKISSPRIRYPGSLFCYSQSEAGQEKGVVIATLEKKPEDDEFHFRAFETTRKLRVPRGTLEELISSAGACPKGPPDAQHDYVIAVLTDQTLPFEAFRRLNSVFPGLLHVSRELNWERSDAESADLAVRSRAREISDRDVLAQFIAGVSVNELLDEDREWLISQLEAFTRSEAEEGRT